MLTHHTLTHHTLAHLCALLNAENGWALSPADDGSLAFQTGAGTTVTLSPLIPLPPDLPHQPNTPSNRPGESDSLSSSDGIRFICDTGVIATAMSADALRDMLLFNFVLTNTMGGGLSMHPERGTIVLSMALSTFVGTDTMQEVAADTERATNATTTAMTALLAIVRVADEIRESLRHSQSLCAVVPPALASASSASSADASPRFFLNQPV